MNETRPTHRSEIIDIMRAIAIILVVLGHALIFCKRASWLMSFCYSFHMPLLFTISGYVTAVSWRRGKLVRSAKRLLVPYAIGALLVIPIMRTCITDRLGECFVTSWRQALLSNRSLWFLPCCFFLIAVYSLSRVLLHCHDGRNLDRFESCRSAAKQTRRRHSESVEITRMPKASALKSTLPTIISFALALMPVGVLYVVFPQVDYSRSVLSYAPSFLLGICLAKLIPANRLCGLAAQDANATLLPSYFFTLASILLFAMLSASYTITQADALKPLTGLASLVPVCCMARLIARHRLMAAIFGYVGQSTLLIYVLDFFTTPFVIWRLWRLAAMGRMPEWLLLPLTLAYVPLAVLVFCFVRKVWVEMLKPRHIVRAGDHRVYGRVNMSDRRGNSHIVVVNSQPRSA